MIFGKKDKGLKKCEGCGGKSEDKFSFCPHCGNNFVDSRKEREDFGLLGKNDMEDYEGDGGFQVKGFGMMDRLMGSMLNSMMKNLDKQFEHQFKDLDRDLDRADVRTFPNGVSIKISGPFDASGRLVKRPVKKKKVMKREVNENQLKRISSLPRSEAKASVKRLGDRVVYELSTPGLDSVEDVFISKLENGYEIKAIAEKKVYVNSVPINLPLSKYSVSKNKLFVEFVVGGRE